MSTSVPRKKEKTRKEQMNEAFATATRGLAVDVPVLLHGSLGGSLYAPGSNSCSSSHQESESQFDPELTANAARDTHHLIAALTAQYIHRLVDAALDVREMQLSGSPQQHHHNTLAVELPPPPLEALYTSKLTPQTEGGGGDRIQESRKRSAAAITSWDTPLPKPRIRSKMHRDDPNKLQPKTNHNNDDVAADQWVGAVGLDMWQKSRPRAIYTQHRTVTAQHFTFPLCHDSYVYGRIRELQAAKVNVMEPLLHDTTVWDVIRTEGQLQQEEILRSRRRRHHQTKRKKIIVEPKIQTNNNNNSDDDSDNDKHKNHTDLDESSEMDDLVDPTWPGLERLLPTHRW